ncbi:TetR/AcrR family transcriptional regulator [Acidaminobacter sp. JC074]|uniref:TetR/AcrR family transcriptional regulator n=1 Tax=Acidaminobacter sp. JC074 TaxID=2530199 RepID=UPI001F0FA97D|nr:TetR/AcrR family transcriptional regulator [Acidaminobacter sp. JC074]
MKKTDLRVKRTALSLEKALFKLIKNKTLSEISIRELTAEAMISRQTFYAHFDTKEELYLVMAQGFYEELNQEIIKKKETLGLMTDQEVFDLAGDYYQKKKEDIKILFSINNKDLIMKSLGEPAKMMYRLIGMAMDEENDELMTDLISGLTYTMIKNWISKKNTTDVRQAIEGMMKILSLMNSSLD